MTSDEFSRAAFGTRKVTGTAKVTCNAQGFRVDEDTVIGAYELSVAGADAVEITSAADPNNFTAATGLKAYELQTVADCDTIKSVTLVSGSITLIKK